MNRTDGQNYTGNDQYMGYCVDLTKRVSEIVNFTYEFKLVKDKKFGAKGRIKAKTKNSFIIINFSLIKTHLVTGMVWLVN